MENLKNYHKGDFAGHCPIYIIIIIIYIYGIERDLAHIFSSFQIISSSKRHLCPLQLVSYALEMSLSIMELQGPEFLITLLYSSAACVSWVRI